MTVGSASAPALRAARISAGLSQQALAERAGCSISMVQFLERGLTPKSSEVLTRILAVLNVAGKAA